MEDTTATATDGGQWEGKRNREHVERARVVNPENVSVGPATRGDLPQVLALLEETSLHPDGLEDHLATALVARAEDRIVGSTAVEFHGSHALLRSVAGDRRGGGLGQRLTGEALALARERGATAVYVLTETADGFFPRFGFSPVERREVPDGVRGSVEFVSACPESARAMFLPLDADAG